jgi:hypothetical protein
LVTLKIEIKLKPAFSILIFLLFSLNGNAKRKEAPKYGIKEIDPTKNSKISSLIYYEIVESTLVSYGAGIQGCSRKSENCIAYIFYTKKQYDYLRKSKESLNNINA